MAKAGDKNVQDYVVELFYQTCGIEGGVKEITGITKTTAS